jgi:SAM-dependent methyltransferase
MKELAERTWQILACNQCGTPLTRNGSGAKCGRCNSSFGTTDTGALDLRLQRGKAVSVEFEVGAPLVRDGFEFKPLELRSQAEVDFSGTRVPWHLTPALLSHFPRARAANGAALDLGCGSGLHRDVCERAGFHWVGLDYAAREAPIMGDGHALPFLDGSFEFVLSIAVLEHIQNPFVLAKEVYRVLQPGGLYIGTVAFLEPFHGNSFYHHTYLGTYNTLSSAAFQIERVAPNPSWSGLRAQATMGGLFPRLPAAIGTGLVWPLEQLHRLWWAAGRRFSPKAGEVTRLLTNTGAFEFIARKPAVET